MRSRLIFLIEIAVAMIAIVAAVVRLSSLYSGSAKAPTVLPTNQTSYLGVYEHEALQSYRPIAEFARAAGAHPNLVGYYSGWGEPFEASFAETVSRHGATTILQWDPTLASSSKIASGGYDRYLRSFADSVREFRYPVVIGFGTRDERLMVLVGLPTSARPNVRGCVAAHCDTLSCSACR